jgi:hypothetical protein
LPTALHVIGPHAARLVWYGLDGLPTADKCRQAKRELAGLGGQTAPAYGLAAILAVSVASLAARRSM